MNRGIKVLQLGKHYPPVPGGIESVTYDITEGLNAAGVRCDVLCANLGNRSVEETRSAYRVSRAGSLGKLASTSIAPALIAQLRRLAPDYDVIHSHCPDPMGALALAIVRPRCRVVLEWHADIVRRLVLKRLYSPLQKWLLSRADLIVASSPTYLEGSADLAPYREKCAVVPFGIDDHEMTSDPARFAKIRARYAGRKVVLAIGRMVYYKGFQNLVEAASRLDDSFAVVIGGDGPLLEVLRKQIGDLGVASRVELLGYVPDEDLGSWYAACDVFCLPSVMRSEAFGIVQIEAMSFGKPVIATRIEGSGTAWVNEHGVSGLNVATRDPDALAAAIREICEDPVTRERYGAGARKRFEECFTREKMAASLIAHYRRLLDTPAVHR